MSGAIGVTPCTYNAVVLALLYDDGAYIKWYCKWPDLATRLELSPEISHKIRYNIRQVTITEILTQILIEWVSKESQNATLEKLVAILNSMKMQRAVTSLKSNFSSCLENSEEKQSRNAGQSNIVTVVTRCFSRSDSETADYPEATENQRCLNNHERKALDWSNVWNARKKVFVSIFISVFIILGITIGIWFLKFHNVSDSYKSHVNTQSTSSFIQSVPGSVQNVPIISESTKVTGDMQTSGAIPTTRHTTERPSETTVYVEKLDFNEIIKRLNRFQGEQIVLVLKISTENSTDNKWSFTYNTTVPMPCIEMEGPFTSHSLANFLRSTTIETSWLKLVRNQLVCCSTLPDTETSCWDKKPLRSMKSDDLEKLITTHIERCASK